MATMEQLTNQVSILTQQLEAQEIKLNSVNIKFQLTPDQIIRNFNEIQPFSGENSYNLKSFLNTVESVESLCGNDNYDLRCYCLKKMINSKITGRARDVILEIPENDRTWDAIVETLTLRFRPRKTIHQLLFQARDIKVFNLKDLFYKLTKIKSEANEICDFDEEETFTYQAIDKELVQILKSKIIPIAQLQIDQTKSLFELDNILCQSEVYLSEEIIKIPFKINKNQENKYEKSKLNPNKRNDFLNPNIPNPNQSNNYNNNSGQYKKPNFNNQKQYRGQNYYNNYSVQKPNYNNNRSGQYRHYNKPEPMEIDHVKEKHFNGEVNFTN